MTDWKTTLTGIIGGVAITLLPILQGGNFDYHSLLIGTVIGILGVLAKDFGS